jgi:hypothetical protein
MKTTLFIILALLSLNLFAGEVGEDQKSDCAFTNQSAKREAKEVASSESQEEKKEASGTISK